MRPLADWQLREAMDCELRRPVWHIILDAKAADLLTHIGLVQLDSVIHFLGDPPGPKGKEPRSTDSMAPRGHDL